MLDKLRIVDFKGIHDLVVSPGRLTVFVGPNGVGKTSILEAVALAGLLIDDRQFGNPAKDYLVGHWDRAQLIRRGADGFRIEVEMDGAAELVEVTAGTGVPRVGVQRGERLSRLQDVPESKLLRAWRMRLDPGRIAAPAHLRSPPMLGHDGSGLAVFLQYVHGHRDASFDKIEAAMRAIVPEFRQVKFEPTSWKTQETEVLGVDEQQVPRLVTREHHGVALSIAFADGSVVPAAHVSEGTLLALAVMTMAYAHQSQHCRLLLVDDLDRGLHPVAQHRLIAALKAVLAEEPDLQILATTHSPALVNACEPEDVRLVERRSDGVVARAATDQPEVDDPRERRPVGEFWSAVGESWLVGPSGPIA